MVERIRSEWEGGTAAKKRKTLVGMEIKIAKNKPNILVRRGESTSVDMEAMALGDTESETAVGIPVTERSRNLVEQAEQSAQATSPGL